MAQVEVSGVFAFAKQVKQEVSIAFCVRRNLCLSYKLLKHVSHVLRNCLKATEIVKNIIFILPGGKTVLDGVYQPKKEKDGLEGYKLQSLQCNSMWTGFDCNKFIERTIDWSKRNLRCQYSVTEKRNTS